MRLSERTVSSDVTLCAESLVSTNARSHQRLADETNAQRAAATPLVLL